MDFHFKTKLSLKGNEGISGKGDIAKRVMQNEVLCPTRFTLLFSEIEEFLKAKGIRGVSQVEMQKILEGLYEYRLLNDLLVDTDKPKLFVHGTSFSQSLIFVNAKNAAVCKSNLVIYSTIYLISQIET